MSRAGNPVEHLWATWVLVAIDRVRDSRLGSLDGDMDDRRWRLFWCFVENTTISRSVVVFQPVHAGGVHSYRRWICKPGGQSHRCSPCSRYLFDITRVFLHPEDTRGIHG